MNLGIIGRHQALLDTAVATATRLGHFAQGTLIDSEAIAWVNQGAIAALVIGGGVEDPSRRALLEACAHKAIRPVEVFGPGHLEEALKTLESGLFHQHERLAGLGDSYCCLAWGRTLSEEAGATAAAAVIGGINHAALSPRDLALASWARKVVANPNGTSAADVQALRDQGFGDREIFEITAFVAFRLAFSTINDALGVQPDWQLPGALPAEVNAVVSFGHPAAEKPTAA
jgi:hypothetical protein